jgi:FMN phosphatase YigB (HAD superfamily)
VNLELILFDADRTLFDYDRAESDALTSDIAGGIGFGIKTCWYNPTKNPILPGLEPNYEITNLRELLTLI